MTCRYCNRHNAALLELDQDILWELGNKVKTAISNLDKNRAKLKSHDLQNKFFELFSVFVDSLDSLYHYLNTNNAMEHLNDVLMNGSIYKRKQITDFIMLYHHIYTNLRKVKPDITGSVFIDNLRVAGSLQDNTLRYLINLKQIFNSFFGVLMDIFFDKSPEEKTRENIYD